MEDRTITLLNVWRNKPFSVSNFERQRLVELLLCWNLSLVLYFPGRVCVTLQGHQAPGDRETSEICSWISDVNVKEEPGPQVPVGEFTDEEEWQAFVC